MWGIFSVVIHHLQSAAFSERKTWTDASILTVYFIESFVDIAQHSVEKLQIWGLLQTWMRELFSYVVPDWIEMVMEVMRWGLHCFVSGWWAHFVFLFFGRPRVLWEELKWPRANCPAQSVVVRVAGAGGLSSGWTALHGRYSALEGPRNSAFFSDLNGNSLGLKLQFRRPQQR